MTIMEEHTKALVNIMQASEEQRATTEVVSAMSIKTSETKI